MMMTTNPTSTRSSARKLMVALYCYSCCRRALLLLVVVLSLCSHPGSFLGVVLQVKAASAIATSTNNNHAESLSTSLPTTRRYRKDGNDHSRNIRVINKSGVTLDIFWVHSNTGELAHSNTDGAGVPYGGDNNINSYVGHTFEVQEVPIQGRCRQEEECLKGRFQVSSREDQTFTVWKDFTVTAEDHRTRALAKAKETLEGCHFENNTKNGGGEMATTVSIEEQILALTQCMDQKIKQTIAETEEEIAYQASVRVDMGYDLTKYACLDEENATLTVSINNMTWFYDNPTVATTDANQRHRKNQRHLVQTLFDTYESTVYLVNHFITAEQCQALEQYAMKQSQEEFYEQIVSLEAKKDLHVIELLLKVQRWVEEDMDRRLKFNVDPLMMLHKLEGLPSNIDTTNTNSTVKSTEHDGDTCKEDIVDGTGTDRKNIDSLNEKSVMAMHSTPPHSAGTIGLFCSSTGGALHFPKTGVHIPASQAVGHAMFVSHRAPNMETGMDEYNGEFALCLPQELHAEIKVFLFHFN